mgnify:CR=1 FL=1
MRWRRAMFAPLCLWGAAAWGQAESRFVPPAGRVLHIAGQDRESFGEYVRTLCAGRDGLPMPAGAAFYTSLALTGMESAHANLPGDNHQDLPFLLRQSEHMALQFALYLDASQLEGVRQGRFDASIDRLAEFFRRCRRPVYFRIGYEFDGPHNGYDPEQYKGAYRHIADRLRKAGVDNLAYVWHSYALQPTHGGHDPMAWWPGDGYVDWVGVSFFQATGEGKHALNRARLLEIARAQKLPVMICEASAIRETAAQRKLTGQALWDFWYVPFFEFIEGNAEVRAFSIINCDWHSQKQFAALGWGDGRVTADPVAAHNWRGKMREKRYLHGGKELFGLLGWRGPRGQ